MVKCILAHIPFIFFLKFNNNNNNNNNVLNNSQIAAPLSYQISE